MRRIIKERRSSANRQSERGSFCTTRTRIFLVLVCFVTEMIQIGSRLGTLLDYNVDNKDQPSTLEYDIPPPAIRSEIRPSENKTKALPAAIRSEIGPSENKTKAQPAANRREVQPEENMMMVEDYWTDVELYSEQFRSGCKVDGSNLTFLGNGMTGHVFAVDMVCDRTDDDIPRRQKVAMKLKTEVLNASDPKGFYEFKNYAPVAFKLLRNLHTVMYKNLTRGKSRERMEKNLIIPIGEVAINRTLLYKEMALINEKITSYKGIVNVSKDTGPEYLLEGSIYPFTKGQPLEDSQPMWRNIDAGRKQKIVQDLVYQWRYMYEHNTLHCELLDHIFFDLTENQTSIVDFQSNMVLSQPKSLQHLKDDKQRRQLRQLLNAIANICTTPSTKKYLNLWKLPWRTEDAICGRDYGPQFYVNTSFAQTVASAIHDGCPFFPKLEWNEETKTNDTAQMYRDLTEWSGSY